MFGDIAEDFRQYMDAVNMTEIREQWDKYQSPAARRLSGVTIEDANGSRKVDLSTKDGVHAFVQDAFASVLDLTEDGLDKLATLKSDWEIPTKGEAIEKLVGYMPNFAEWASESHDAIRELMGELKEAETFDEATQVLEDAAEAYCTDEKFEAPEKKQSTCEGPRVRLEFVPKKCVVVDHELECLPAKLVLKKRAGRCIMKHLSPAKYKHKECKLEKKWGKDEEKLYGGDSYMAGHVSDQVSDALGGVSRTQ